MIESRLKAKAEDNKAATASNNQPVTVVINNNIGTSKDTPSETAVSDEKTEQDVKQSAKSEKSAVKSKKKTSSKTNKTKK